MDQHKLLEIASYVTNLKMFPYIDAAHFIVMCLIVREDEHVREVSGPNAFSRRHPLASWVASMLMCFAGSIVANLLVGESIVIPFKHHDEVLLASAVWYAVNYSPLDIVYEFLKLSPIRCVVHGAEQLYVANKIHQGVNYALKHYKAAYLIAVTIGVSKGAGHCFIQPIERLVRGVWVPGTNHVLYPSFEFKSAFVASVVFTLHLRRIYIVAPFSVVYFGVVIFLVYFETMSELLATRDPYSPFINIICSVFFGGTVDTLKSMTSGRVNKVANDKDASDLRDIDDIFDKEDSEHEKSS